MNEIELAEFAYEIVRECEGMTGPPCRYVPGSIVFRWYLHDDDSITDHEIDIVNVALNRAFPDDDVQVQRAEPDHDWDWKAVTWSGTPVWGSLRS